MPSRYTPEQLAEAIELSRKGWTYTRIADHQGVVLETISRNLGEYHRNLAQDLRARARQAAGEHVERLSWIVEQALEEWERSKRDAELIKTRKGKGGQGNVDTTEAQIKGRLGDPRLLAEAREAMGEIRELLGVEAILGEPSGQASTPRIVIPATDDRFRDTDTDPDPADPRASGGDPR